MGLFLVYFLCIYNFIYIYAQNNISSKQINALKALFISTNGSSWSWKNNDTSWHFDHFDHFNHSVNNINNNNNNNNINPCLESWEGITCNLNCTSDIDSDVSNNTCNIIEI